MLEGLFSFGAKKASLFFCVSSSFSSPQAKKQDPFSRILFVVVQKGIQPYFLSPPVRPPKKPSENALIRLCFRFPSLSLSLDSGGGGQKRGKKPHSLFGNGLSFLLLPFLLLRRSEREGGRKAARLLLLLLLKFAREQKMRCF